MIEYFEFLLFGFFNTILDVFTKKKCLLTYYSVIGGGTYPFSTTIVKVYYVIDAGKNHSLTVSRACHISDFVCEKLFIIEAITVHFTLTYLSKRKS
jgi:hypothetical protein